MTIASTKRTKPTDLMKYFQNLNNADESEIKETIREHGRSVGHDIAQSNPEASVSECVQTEREHYRQFSPFELISHDMNTLEIKLHGTLSGEIWDVYESGVREGVENVKKRINRNTGETAGNWR